MNKCDLSGKLKQLYLEMHEEKRDMIAKEVTDYLKEKKYTELNEDEYMYIARNVIANHPVLLNRLHEAGVKAGKKYPGCEPEEYCRHIREELEAHYGCNPEYEGTVDMLVSMQEIISGVWGKDIEEEETEKAAERNRKRRDLRL